MKRSIIFGIFLFITLIPYTDSQAPTTIAAWNFDASTTVSTSGTGTFSYCSNQGSYSWVTGNPSTGMAIAITNWLTKCTSACCGFTFCTDTTGYATITCSYEVSSSASGGGANILYAFNGATITPNPAATTKASTFINTIVTLPSGANNNAHVVKLFLVQHQLILQIIDSIMLI